MLFNIDMYIPLEEKNISVLCSKMLTKFSGVTKVAQICAIVRFSAATAHKKLGNFTFCANADVGSFAQNFWGASGLKRSILFLQLLIFYY